MHPKELFENVYYTLNDEDILVTESGALAVYRNAYGGLVLATHEVTRGIVYTRLSDDQAFTLLGMLAVRLGDKQ